MTNRVNQQLKKISKLTWSSVQTNIIIIIIIIIMVLIIQNHDLTLWSGLIYNDVKWYFMERNVTREFYIPCIGLLHIAPDTFEQRVENNSTKGLNGLATVTAKQYCTPGIGGSLFIKPKNEKKSWSKLYRMITDSCSVPLTLTESL